MWISEAERDYRAGQDAAWRKLKMKRRKGRGKPNKTKRRKFKSMARKHRGECEKRCRAYLSQFWPKYTRAGCTEERLMLLQEAANPPWVPASESLRKSIRARYENRKFCFLRGEIVECGACAAAKAKENHHIIPVAFGGINDPINLIKICYSCHNVIHPWMVKA